MSFFGKITSICHPCCENLAKWGSGGLFGVLGWGFGGGGEEGEVDGGDEEEEGDEVVPADGFAFEDDGHDDGEDGECDCFLDDFQLHEGEGAAVAGVADAVGGHHEGVFGQGEEP